MGGSESQPATICSTYPDCCGGLSFVQDEYVNQTYAETHHYCYPDGKPPAPKTSCEKILKFYKDITQETMSTAGFNYALGNSYCCGSMYISCNSEAVVTDINWSFLFEGKRKLKLPESVGSLNGLLSLDLSGNRFYGSIPKNIGSLTTLKYLNLSHNAFTGSIENIDFKSMISLEKLDISHNKIGDAVPYNINYTNLKYFSIEYNRFSGGLPAFNLFRWGAVFLNEKYNMPKPSLQKILYKRRKSYEKVLREARNIFDQVNIDQPDDIQMICPENLFNNSYLLVFAETAINSMNSSTSSREAASLVKKKLISAKKIQILASSSYCRRGIPWDYDGLYGPARWQIEQPSCGHADQSPINVEPLDTENFSSLNNSDQCFFSFSNISVGAIPSRIQRSETLFRINPEHDGNGLNGIHIGEEFYMLKHLEIHTPSEHRIDGKDYVAEVQFYFWKKPQGSSYPSGNSSYWGYPSGNSSYWDYPSGNSSYWDYPSGNSSYGDYPSGNSSYWDYPSGNSSYWDYPSGNSSYGDYPSGNSSYGDYPSGNSSYGDYPSGNSSYWDYPSGNFNLEKSSYVAIAAFVSLEKSSSEPIASIANAFSSEMLMVFLDYPRIFSSLQDSETFFPYKGSYTSPPCFENVSWLVSSKSVFNISVADLFKIKAAQGFNSRDTQPLGENRAANLFDYLAEHS